MIYRNICDRVFYALLGSLFFIHAPLASKLSKKDDPKLSKLKQDIEKDLSHLSESQKQAVQEKFNQYIENEIKVADPFLKDPEQITKSININNLNSLDQFDPQPIDEKYAHLSGINWRIAIAKDLKKIIQKELNPKELNQFKNASEEDDESIVDQLLDGSTDFTENATQRSPVPFYQSENPNGLDHTRSEITIRNQSYTENPYYSPKTEFGMNTKDSNNDDSENDDSENRRETLQPKNISSHTVGGDSKIQRTQRSHDTEKLQKSASKASLASLDARNTKKLNQIFRKATSGIQETSDSPTEKFRTFFKRLVALKLEPPEMEQLLRRKALSSAIGISQADHKEILQIMKKAQENVKKHNALREKRPEMR